MDVHKSFLYGNLHEEFYMKLSIGFQPSSSGTVCLHLKSLYGLLQAPHCWFTEISHAIKQSGL